MRTRLFLAATLAALGLIVLLGQESRTDLAAAQSTSCTNPAISAAPSSAPSGTTINVVAQGFTAGAQVTLTVTGPAQTARTVFASQNCQVAFGINTAGDPGGNYTVSVSGACHCGGTQTLRTTYFLTGGGSTVSPTRTPTPGCYFFTDSVSVQQPNCPTSTPTVFAPTLTATPPFFPTHTPTFGPSCGVPAASISNSRIRAGQGTNIVATGFLPGSLVQLQINSPGGANNISTTAGVQANCVASFPVSTSPTDAVGHYTGQVIGQNSAGNTVIVNVDFDVFVDATSTAVPFSGPGDPNLPEKPTEIPTFTSIPGGPPPNTFTPTPTPTATISTTTQGPPAPLQVNQSLALVRGAPVPAVGQTSEYEHVVRIDNTSAQAMQLTVQGLFNGTVSAAALNPLLQGQTLSVGFSTDYSNDSQIVSASSNIGQTEVRGQSVVWNGQIGPGQSLELRTTVAQTPTNSLTLNQPIRGQSIAVVDQSRGQTLTVPPAQVQPPQLPPEQRLVNPPPPPIDPITLPRYFPQTGFTVVDDDIWVYFNRRGGLKTFGAPISRSFVLSGTQVQLFEKGLLQVVDTNSGRSVSSVNLLEYPFLSFDNLGDTTLPPVDESLLATAPDAGASDFGSTSQAFVQSFAPESFEEAPTRFYTTFLGTVLYFDAFFTSNGDPALVPLFNLEIWGLPTSYPTYLPIDVDVVDPGLVDLRFQRGVMRYNAYAGTTTGLDLGRYLQAVIVGDASLPGLADAAAATSPLWAQYNSEADQWVDRPDELPDTNLVLAFELE